MTRVTLYGLGNCDKCRKARKWLDSHDIPCQLIDYRQQPVAPETLVDWARRLGGWDRLVNKASPTWRRLPPEQKEPADDAAWTQLIAANPTLVRRPVVCDATGEVSVGFREADFQQRFGA